MIKDGVYGASTLTGLQFEKNTDLEAMLCNTGIFKIKAMF